MTTLEKINSLTWFELTTKLKTILKEIYSDGGNQSSITPSDIGAQEKIFDSVSELKNISGKNVGDRATTYGFYSGTLDGGAIYKKVSPTGLTPNDMDIIQGNDGSYWKLQIPESRTAYHSMFGCDPNNGAHTPRFQRFLDWCNENNVTRDFSKGQKVNTTVVMTGDTDGIFICGTLNAENLDLDPVVSIESSRSEYYGNLHVIGGTASSYTSKITKTCISFKNCLSRNYFQEITAEGAKFWGLDMRENAGKSNIFNNIEKLTTTNCGAGEGSRAYNFNVTSSVNTGTVGSTSQKSELSISASDITNFKVLSTLITIDGRKHVVTDVDSGTNKIKIYPWIKNGLSYPITAKSHGGGGLLQLGGNSANLKIGQFDVIGCGQGFRSGGLYGASIQQYQAQGCGVSLAIGYDPSNNNLGLDIGKIHVEANECDILQISRVKTNSVINSVSALNLDKCSAINTIDGSDKPTVVNKLGVTLNWNNSRYEPRQEFYPQNYIDSRSNVIVGNNPEICFIPIQKRNSPTLELTWDEGANKWGYDSFLGKFIGTGGNNQPTGTITFNLNSSDQTSGITVMGGTTYTITGLSGPAYILGRFDYITKNWDIINLLAISATLPSTYDSLTISKLVDAAKLNFIRDDGTTNDGDVIGGMYFYANDTQVDEIDRLGASITVVAENAWGTGSKAPAALVFSTRNLESESPIERMRITGAGEIKFSNMPIYADDTAATILSAGVMYQTATGELRIKL